MSYLKSKKIHISEAELKCKNGCGFYGNPAWHGYCSKCYRELCHQKKKHEKLKSVGTVQSKLPTSIQLLSYQENPAEVSNCNDKNVENSFFTSKAKISKSFSEEIESSFQNPSQRFADFLCKINSPAGNDIHHILKSFVERIKQDMTTVDQISDLMQDFYQSIGDRMVKHTLFHVRIRSLYWVSSEYLECAIDQNLLQVQEALMEAITAIIEMDSKYTPQDKLECIVHCSQATFMMLRLSQGQPASADEFLPVLIYVILQANPPRLHSNISFISHFCNPSKLSTGEPAYYFTNLCCAVSFIEQLNATHLNISEEQFNRSMKGETFSSSIWQHEPMKSEALEKMSKNLIILKNIDERKTERLEKVNLLHQHIFDFQEQLSDKLNTLRQVCTWILEDEDNTIASSRSNQISINSSIIDDSPNHERIVLPEPLKPIIYSGFSSQGEKIPSIPCETASNKIISSSESELENVSEH